MLGFQRAFDLVEKCPDCGRVMQEGFGLWKCRHCGKVVIPKVDNGNEGG